MDPLSKVKQSLMSHSSTENRLRPKAPDKLKATHSFDRAVDSRPGGVRDMMDNYAREIERFNEESKTKLFGDSEIAAIEKTKEQWVGLFKEWRPSDDYVRMLSSHLTRYLEKKELGEVAAIRESLPYFLDEAVPMDWCMGLSKLENSEADRKAGANYSFCLGVHYALKVKFANKDQKDQKEDFLKKAERWAAPAQSVELYTLLAKLREKKGSQLYNEEIAERHRSNISLQKGRNEVEYEKKMAFINRFIPKMDG